MAGEIPQFDLLKIIGNKNKFKPWIRRIPFEENQIEVLYPTNIMNHALVEYLGDLIEFKKDFFWTVNAKILGKVRKPVILYSHPFYTEVLPGTVRVTDVGTIECFTDKYFQKDSFNLYDPYTLRFELIIDPLNWQNEDRNIIRMLESRGDKDEVNQYEIPNIGLTLISKLRCPSEVLDRSREIDFGLNQLQLLLQLCHGLATTGVDYITKSSRISRYTL